MSCEAHGAPSESAAQPQERLSLIAPELAQTLTVVGDDRRLRQAARAASARVLSRSEIDDPRVDDGLSLLERELGDADVRSQLDAFSVELDEVGWDLRDAWDAGHASEEEYLAAFARARAVSALAWALHSDSLVAALEATYEAHCAYADGSDVVKLVKQELQRS